MTHYIVGKGDSDSDEIKGLNKLTLDRETHLDYPENSKDVITRVFIHERQRQRVSLK